MMTNQLHLVSWSRSPNARAMIGMAREASSSASLSPCERPFREIGRVT